MESSNETVWPENDVTEEKEEFIPTVQVTYVDGPKLAAGIQRSGSSLLQMAEEAALSITTVEAHEEAMRIGSEVNKRIAFIETKMETEIVGPARKVWKNGLKLKDELLAPWQTILKKLDVSCSKFRVEQARKARIEEEARQAEVRKIERDRLAREQAELKKRRDAEEKARIEQAEAAEKAGAPERVDVILSVPTAMPMMPPPPPVTSVPARATIL